MGRKAIGNKLRFEVFKRDSFTSELEAAEADMEAVKEFAKQVRTWTEFRTECEAWLAELSGE